MILLGITSIAQTKYTISGVIKDENSSEDLIGATVIVAELKSGTVTNTYGFYSLTLPEGKYTLEYTYIGYEKITKLVNLNKDYTINLSLKEAKTELGDVTVTGERIDANVEKVEMSTMKLEMKTIKKMPALLGEVDLIKSIQLLPGVQSAGEGGTGFHVRGGSVDQNLILLDGANVYNPSHVGGIFSVFNGDAVRNVKLYKGGIPAEFGGRLASVLDIKMKEGNAREFHAQGGIGVISSRLTVEGPILKDKASFILSGRRTYVDVFFPLFNNDALSNSRVFFYDLNGKLNWQVNENNRIFLSGYFGQDVLEFDTLFTVGYGNRTITARWNHMYSKQLFSNTTFIYSNYNYKLGFSLGAVSPVWVSKIIDYGVKNDYSYYLNPDNKIDFGLSVMYHDFKPGELADQDTIDPLPDKYVLESAVYLQNEQKVNDWLSLQYGLRFSAFSNMGRDTVLTLNNDYQVIDTSVYEPGEIYNTYFGLEPRLAVRLKINDMSSVKLSYNRMVQYIQLASNTTSVTPLDLWFPSNQNIEPQLADQIALGYFRNFKENSYETSMEVYYKKMQNAVDFKDNAVLFFNEFLDPELRFGDGYSYGMELLAKKQVGDFNGWVSYTLSRTRRTIPALNNGKEFFAPYDRTHDVSIVLSYDIFERLNVSTNWAFSSTIPITLPTKKYVYEGITNKVYAERNSVRVPNTNYHRLDLAVTYKNKKKQLFKGKREFQDSWVLSIYNVYYRHNMYSVQFNEQKNSDGFTNVNGLSNEEKAFVQANIPDYFGGSNTSADKLYLFKIIPAITYNFEF